MTLRHRVDDETCAVANDAPLRPHYLTNLTEHVGAVCEIPSNPVKVHGKEIPIFVLESVKKLVELISGPLAVNGRVFAIVVAKLCRRGGVNPLRIHPHSEDGLRERVAQPRRSRTEVEV